jgi:inner membrane protein
VNPVTHFLAGWAVGDATPLPHRDRNLIAVSGVLPDLDGLGAVVDVGNRLLGREESVFYGLYHHWLMHGLFGAVAISAGVALLAKRRLAVFGWAMAVTHLHFLCDLVGSRGPGEEEVWPIAYLAPFSKSFTLEWSGQWELNAWPNIVVTVALLAWVFYRAASAGRSPVSLLGERANRAFVATVQSRLRTLSRKS